MSIEIERKFLVLNDSYKENAYSHFCIRNGYLCNHNHRTVRVLIYGDRAYLTSKGRLLESGFPHYEFEKEIALKEGQQLIRLCEPDVIEKERWLVKFAGHLFEVDEFFGVNVGLVTAEVELSSVDESLDIPNFIGKEITGDHRFYNSFLRTNPYCKWTQ